MAARTTITAHSLRDACGMLISHISRSKIDPSEHASWHAELFACEAIDFFWRVFGVARIYFKSRDRSFEFFGLGVADVVDDREDGLLPLVPKARKLQKDQFYFGGIRFDEEADIAPEWRSFGKKIFILPMLSVLKKKGRTTLCLTYRRDGHLTASAWFDHAMSLLKAIADEGEESPSKATFEKGAHSLSKSEYCSNVSKALRELAGDPHKKKVVLGRRSSVIIKGHIDPAELFFRLQKKSKNAFLFFFDNGHQDVFFGGSPELLYRRQGYDFETESLAGTRPRSSDAMRDVELREELILSFKENHEHALVCLHVEDKLRHFGITDLLSSKVETITLPYVQHLIKRYQGKIIGSVDDLSIIQALYPTPAVCGIDLDWARAFIRAHEGFDRGFYAGPIGIIGKDEAELAVAIRSALFHRQSLYLYAACGIVPGSHPEEEWEELNNKEQNILSIFE